MTAVLGFFQGELNRKQLWHHEKKKKMLTALSGIEYP